MSKGDDDSNRDFAKEYVAREKEVSAALRKYAYIL
jgi:hypothetical protein